MKHPSQHLRRLSEASHPTLRPPRVRRSQSVTTRRDKSHNSAVAMSVAVNVNPNRRACSPRSGAHCLAVVRRKKKKKNSQTVLDPIETTVAVAATVRASAAVTTTGIATVIASATEASVILDATSATETLSSAMQTALRKTLTSLRDRIRPPIPVTSPSALDDDVVDAAVSDSRKALQRKPLILLLTKKPLTPTQTAIRRATEEGLPTSATRGDDGVSDAAWTISPQRRLKPQPHQRPQQ